MRALLLLLLATPAAADPLHVVEDGVFGIDPAPKGPLLTGFEAALGKCSDTAEGSAVMWVDVDKTGHVTSAHVHGAGKVDACVERALRGAKVETKLTAPIVVLGHVDADGQKSPRISTVAIVVDAHDAPSQLTVERVEYTANRALDIAQALDGSSAGIAACAGKRPKSDKIVQGIAWYDGHAIVMHTGAAAYDECVGKVLGAIKLPRDDSALWMELSIAPPAEPLAPRGGRTLSHDQQLRDALTTAVRVRKLHLLGCLDGHPKTTLTTVHVALAKGKASIKAVSTGDADADACVRDKLHDVAIDAAKEADQLELDIALEAE
jgi:hypothetical protein